MIVRVTRKKSFISLSTTNEGKRKKGNTKRQNGLSDREGKKNLKLLFSVSLQR